MALIRVPFADSGDKTAIPVASQSDGSVSYVQGYPLAYSLDPETDAGAKRIERLKMNQLFYDITSAIREIQRDGVKPYISAEENGGSAFAYGPGALVIYNGIVYQSLTGNNTQLPTVAANWSQLSNQVNSVAVMPSTYAGDLNTLATQGIYSLTAAASNAPLPQTALLEHFERSGGTARVQIWHSCSASASVANRHYVRTGTVSAGTVTWSPWTQTTLRPVELTGTQDVSGLVESGTYYASTWANAPVSVPAVLDVTSVSGSSIRQVFHALGSNVRYSRTFIGSWGPWKQIVTSDNNPGRLLGFQRFTLSGSYTPTPGTSFIVVEMVGAGGGGGGSAATSTAQVAIASGGSAGAFLKARLDISSLSLPVALTVGSGGKGGAAGNNGGGGGSASIFGANILVAPGGPGGAGSSAVGNTSPAANSVPARSNLSTGGNVSNSAGEGGSPGLFCGSALSGSGGSTVYGSGGSSAANANGNTAAGFGAGGGGASSLASTAARPGGDGSDGVIIIWEYSQ